MYYMFYEDIRNTLRLSQAPVCIQLSQVNTRKSGKGEGSVKEQSTYIQHFLDHFLS